MKTLIFFSTLMLFVNPIFAADGGRKITIYPMVNSVSYTEKAGEGSCRMSLADETPAEILSETETHIQVQIDTKAAKNFGGCYKDQLLNWRDISKGWLPKDEISYGSDDDDEAEVGSPLADADVITGSPAAPLEGLGEMLDKLRKDESGIKTSKEIEEYLACYPKSETGRRDYEQNYRYAMSEIARTFTIKAKGRDLYVDPALFRCMLRRESGFEADAGSPTGARGLGQHTKINIIEMRRRLARNGWERKLWDRYMKSMKNTPSGKRMIAQCGDAGIDLSTFNNKLDAACPIKSLAASAIYMLQIQTAMSKSSNVQKVDWNQDLNYNLAIAAAYNLGDGAAAKAVDDLAVGGWVDSIKKSAPNKSKKQEVQGHVDAIRNCMKKDVQTGMAPGDRPVCEAYAGGGASASRSGGASKGQKLGVPVPPRRPSDFGSPRNNSVPLPPQRPGGVH